LDLIMPNLSIKDVPEMLAQKLRQRAARHHRSLQGELMAIVEAAVGGSAGAPASGQHAMEPSAAGYDSLELASGDRFEKLDAVAAANRRPSVDREARLARLREIADSADASFRAASRLTREETHDRALLRRLGI
jgi:plasmid stability protein